MNSQNIKKINLFTCITSIEDVEQLVRYIYDELGVNFHPDDDFNDYINSETKEATFNIEDAKILNSLIDDCFKVCERENVDFYEIALKYNPTCLFLI